VNGGGTGGGEGRKVARVISSTQGEPPCVYVEEHPLAKLSRAALSAALARSLLIKVPCKQPSSAPPPPDIPRSRDSPLPSPPRPAPPLPTRCTRINYFFPPSPRAGHADGIGDLSAFRDQTMPTSGQEGGDRRARIRDCASA